MVYARARQTYFKYKDTWITDLTILPLCAIKWFYALRIKKQLFPFQLVGPSGSKGTLYQHGTWTGSKGKVQAVVILHGLHGHPFVMLHLAELAKKVNPGPVYSLHLTYDKTNCDSHRLLLRQAVDTIEQAVDYQGLSLEGIVMVGHSMGATEAAYIAFVEKDKRVSALISIAGRLKFVESLYHPSSEAFKLELEKIHAGIQSMPGFPLYQIVGGKDWNAPLESTLVRREPGYFHVVEEGMHFNIIFHQEVRRKFSEFLQRALS